MPEQLPPALPRRDMWARIGPLYAALRRTAPTLTTSKCQGPIPATGPDPFVWVTSPRLGPYRVQWRGDAYEWTSGQWSGSPLAPDPEVAARQIAARMGAPIHTP